MGTNTNIAWCHHTWNPWRGCSRVSAGCDHCYAERQSARNPDVLGQWGKDAPRVVAADSYWRLPRQWNAEAKRAGQRRRVFLGSMMDFCEDYEGPLERGGRVCWVSDEEPNRWPTMPANVSELVEVERDNIAAGVFRPLTLVDLRERIWLTIAETTWLDWLILTKRPQNFRRALPWTTVAPGEPWRHVWLGVTVENQAAADERIPELVRIPAAVRFLSLEPLLGPVDLWPWLRCPHMDLVGVDDDDSPNKIWRCVQCGMVGPQGGMCDKSLIDWAIVGGESGPNARPMHPGWARRIRDACQTPPRVAFFFKQWGEWRPLERNDPSSNRVTDTAPDRTPVCLVKPDGRVVRPYCALHAPGAELVRIGKHAAGRLLDGQQWNQFPQVSGLKSQA